MKSHVLLLMCCSLFAFAGCSDDSGITDGVCGDTVHNAGEQCDDGNDVDGDGCSSVCAIEVADPAACGDGSLDMGETCDDGNNADGDGCSANCFSDESCGNRILDDGEGCDDGNDTDNDGCDSSCIVELTPYCGDGNQDAGEGCDDGNNVNGDGCTITCADEATCGDGTKDPGEQCDDGNFIAADGCSTACTTTVIGCPGTLSLVGTPVGTPTNHVTSGSTQGNWMLDPVETLGAGKIWEMDGYRSSSISEYASLADMIAGTPSDTWELTNGFDGTGAVIWGGYLYYNKTDSPNMIKYDLDTHTEVLDVELPNAGFGNTYRYQWGGFSDIDFAVDELGLWVVYATDASNGNIVISKLDESNLSVGDTFETTRFKEDSGNSFMICGTLYVIANYRDAETTIDYMYDTKVSTETAISIPWTNPGRYNSMVDYNYGTRKLYSWDGEQHQVYPLGESL